MPDAVSRAVPEARMQGAGAVRDRNPENALPEGLAGAPCISPQVAVEFEAAFLAEMLKQLGLTRALGSRAGDAGDTGFSDLLTREIAKDIARSRPIGIAEALVGRLASGE
ncbi:hypothetical protein H0I76_02865 [Limibaculum sp. M0105]|uniref:Flagellar biosynthesis protein FlgJ n=1 Tax=Thermohalobaculum xanthum TaxID=2753746 RepID=A0A8J7M4H0_9RHOB|nr:hypothetical protein [Thermohalobaculum xanthum]MBK0398119.1 hypothetical protein [Thermohalobaculum xanthum]